MYLHLGQNEVIAEHRIIGIFDLDKCSTSKRTRDYLSAAEREGVVLDISGDLQDILSGSLDLPSVYNK